jgi:transcriptional regulator with XRE-family HTH domain
MMENDNINSWYAMSDPALMETLGIYLKETRLSQNKTQAEIADAAGINRSTLSQLENGSGGTILSLIQVLRALEALHLFKNFQTEQKMSPLELARLEQSKRKRAGGSKNESNEPESGW